MLLSKSPWRLGFNLTCFGILASQFFPVTRTMAESYILQFSEAMGICPIQNSFPKRSFESSKYKVYICLGDTKNPLGYYVRVTKSDDIKITLPIARKNGETYIAKLGEISYIVSPYEFMVNKLGRILNRDRVTSAISGNGQLLVSACPQGENVLIEAVTKSFIVYICGNDKPGSYVGVARMGNEKVTIPLRNIKADGAFEKQNYVAVKGNTRFFLTRETLEIMVGDATIVKEKVIRWQ